MSKLVLYSQNIPGNLHQAATWLNRWGYPEYVLTLDCISGSNTIVVYRLPVELRDKLWKENGNIGEPK